MSLSKSKFIQRLLAALWIAILFSSPCFSHPRHFSDRLWQAVWKGDLESVHLLPEEFFTHQDQYKDEEGCTPLFVSLRNKHIDFAKFLLQKGARTDLESKRGDTALILAIHSGLLDGELLSRILNAGASLEHVHQETGMTAAMYAVSGSQLSALKILSDFGVSLDRKNLKNQKTVFDYVRAGDRRTLAYLMKSRRVLSKMIGRHDYHFLYDALGFPKKISFGPESVSYFVKDVTGQIKIAKFFYDLELYNKKNILEPAKAFHFESYAFIKKWKTWFDNNLDVKLYESFHIKDYVEGKTLAHWMSGVDVPYLFSAPSEDAEQMRLALKNLLKKMIRDGDGFVQNMQSTHLIFNEVEKKWVLIDGGPTVACYVEREHMWVWSEYCPSTIVQKKTALWGALKNYAVGSSVNIDKRDAINFGNWLKDRIHNGKMLPIQAESKKALLELFQRYE
ncbi:MAG: ankyrin repeat domain-containing protein [Oligoflexales bacterium]|nr:ankyrin repeat domain-containing protein [Oligoflexales bacterium]